MNNLTFTEDFFRLVVNAGTAEKDVAWFNALNANPVLGVRSVNFGTAAYNQVNQILNPRIVRLGVQFKW